MLRKSKQRAQPRRQREKRLRPFAISARLVQSGHSVFITIYEKYRIGGQIYVRPHPLALPQNTFVLAWRAVEQVVKRLYPKKKYKITGREFPDRDANPYKPPLGQ